jgi:hypothetical protein
MTRNVREGMIDLDAYRARRTAAVRDAALDHEWDALIAAAADAWTWRDPESLGLLAARLVRVQACVLADWADGVPKHGPLDLPVVPAPRAG